MPTSSVTPLVVHALHDLAAAALPNHIVSVGFMVGSDPAQQVLMIGVDDPGRATAAASSGGGTQAMATMGPPRARDHTGTVTCAALSWNGDSDQAAAMDASYATLAAVEGLLRDDPTLGGLAAPGRMVAQIADDNLQLDHYSGGASALVVFTVAYKARI